MMIKHSKIRQTYLSWKPTKDLINHLDEILNGKFTVFQVFNYSMQMNPERICYIDDGTPYSYKEVNNLINKLANGLIDIGVKKGNHISILEGNKIEFFISYLAILKVGAVIVPIIPRLATSPSEVEYILSHSEAKAIIVANEYLDVVKKIKLRLNNLDIIIVTRSMKDEEKIISFEYILENSIEFEPDIDWDVKRDDLATIIYTSGTIARPKGVMSTHYQILGQMIQILYEGWHGNKLMENRVLNLLPYPHCGYTCFVLSGLLVGASYSSIPEFNPEKVLKVIERDKITTLCVVPTMLNAIVNLTNVKNFDLSTLKRLLYGAAPMPYSLVMKFAELAPNCKLFNGFGMTEANAGITSLHDEDVRTKPGCIGRPISGCEIILVDDNDNEVPDGIVGEICVRGLNIMKGYYKNPDDTKSAMKGGWYHTGDLAYWSDDDFLYLAGRKKEMYIRGGENVYPLDVENVLSSHPDVLEVAVIGVPDEKLGERGKVFIVLKQEKSVNPEEIIKFCKERMAIFKVPEIVEIVEDIPKTSMGKVNKRKLKEMAGTPGEYRTWGRKS